MFHVEHAKNQKSAKKQILRIFFLLFFLFKLFSKNRKKSLTKKIFGAGAPVVGQRLFCMGLKNV